MKYKNFDIDWNDKEMRKAYEDFMCSEEFRDLVEIEKEKNGKNMKRRVKMEQDMRAVNFMINKIEENK